MVLLKLHGEKCDGFLEANHFFKFVDFGYHFLKTFWEQGFNACMIFGYKCQAIYSLFPKSLQNMVTKINKFEKMIGSRKPSHFFQCNFNKTVPQPCFLKLANPPTLPFEFCKPTKFVSLKLALKLASHYLTFQHLSWNYLRPNHPPWQSRLLHSLYTLHMRIISNQNQELVKVTSLLCNFDSGSGYLF